MKHFVRFLTFFFAILLFLSVLLFTASAAEPETYYQQRMQELYTVWDRYRTKESAVGEDTPTADLIWYEYYHRLGPDFPSTEYENTALIDLIYYKGISAAPLAWIYYSHTDTVENEAIRSVFETQLSIINGQNTESSEAVRTAFFLGDENELPGVYECYTALLDSIYAYRLEQLRKTDDSEATSAIIDTAKNRLNRTDSSEDPQNPTPSYTKSTDEDAEHYRTYVRFVETQVTRQRNRDALTEQMTDIYRKLYPGVSFSALNELTASDSVIQAYFNGLPSADSVIRLNSLLQQTVTNLLDRTAQTQGAYTARYLNEALKQQIAICVSNASGTNLGAILANVYDTCFGETYDLDLAKAQGKDWLSSAASAIANVPTDKRTLLDRIVSDYQNERFNACLSLSELNEQIARANRRLTWFSDYLNAWNETAAVLTRFDSSRLTESMKNQMFTDIDRQYTDIDERLRDGESEALTAGRLLLTQTVQNAEVTAFTVKHPILYTENTVTRSDLAALADAVSDADKLSAQAEQALEQCGTLTLLGEHYRMSVLDQINHILSDVGGITSAEQALNQLIQNSRETLRQAVTSLSFRTSAEELELSDFMNRANRFASMAEQAQTVLLHYRSLLKNGADRYTDSMHAVCQTAVDAILSEHSEPDTATDAVRILDRVFVLEQIRDAADGKETVRGIASVLEKAEADLLPDSSTVPSDIERYSENARFQIENLWTAEQMNRQIEQIRDTVSAITDLTDSEKHSYSVRIESVSRYLEIISAATDKSTETEAVRQAENDCAQIIARLQYSVTQMQNAEQAYREKLTQIHALDKPSDGQKNEWKTNMATAYRQFLQTVSATDTDEEANHALQRFYRLLSATLSAATQENLRLTKEAVKQELTQNAETFTQTVMEYSFMNAAEKQSFFNRIQLLLEEKNAAVDTCSDTDAVAQVMESAAQEWRRLFSDAEEAERTQCRSRLKQNLNEIFGTVTEYSAERFAEVEAIIREYQAFFEQEKTMAEYVNRYEEALAKIQSVPTRLDEARNEGIQQFGSVYQALLQRKDCYSSENWNALTEQYTRLLRELSRSDLYSSASDIPALQSKTEDAIAVLRAIRLDAVFTESDSEYSGTITASNQIPSDLLLTVRPSEAATETLQKAIRRAAKLHTVWLSDGTCAEHSLLRLLQTCTLTASADFFFERSELGDGPLYTVSLQLPDGYDLSNLIGLVYLREDGTLEFLEATVENSSVVFTTTHFSEYYLVSAKISNLWPLLVALSALILIELAVLAILFWRRMQRPKGTTLSSLWLPTAIWIRCRPNGGILAACLLGTAALGLGVWIAVLILEEQRLKKQAKRPLTARNEPSVPQQQLPAVAVASAITEATALIPSVRMHQVPVPVSLPKPISEVSAEAADQMMSDEEARNHLQIDPSFGNPERYRGAKRAQINLDIISEHFSAGETVTLNALKAKKLLPNNTEAVKILARGTLNKPLNVVAQDFSASALKMILLTGGTPVRTHASPEREIKRKNR